MTKTLKTVVSLCLVAATACATSDTDLATGEQLASWAPKAGRYVATQLEAVAPANSCAGIDLVFGDFQISVTGEGTYAADESVGTSYECALTGRSADCGPAAEAYDIDYRPYGMDLYMTVTPHEGLTHQVWTSATTFQHRFGGRVTCEGTLCDEFFAPSLDESGCNLSTIASFQLAQ